MPDTVAFFPLATADVAIPFLFMSFVVTQHYNDLFLQKDGRRYRHSKSLFYYVFNDNYSLIFSQGTVLYEFYLPCILNQFFLGFLNFF